MEQEEGERESKQQDNRTNVNTSGGFDQRVQTVYGDQINVAGDVLGDVILKRLDISDVRNQRNHMVLRQTVKRFWIDGVLKSSLQNEILIRLGLEAHSNAVDNQPWDLLVKQPGELDAILPENMHIVDVFDYANQRLLILGAPGSGKTTMLLTLANALLQRSAADPILPTPVIFNLSSWAEKELSLAKWLVDELNNKYNLPKKVAQQWVANDELILLLDGLDEVQEARRGACVEKINQFRQEHVVALAVCGRTTEYEAMITRLKLEVAVVVVPLTQQQIDAYLDIIGPQMTPLHSVLHENVELAGLAQSPLLLNIMTLIYHEDTTDQQSTEQIERTEHQRIFDTYIRRMFQHRGVLQSYPPGTTLHWLCWLAGQMVQHSQTIFLIERVQPEWLVTKNQIIGYRLQAGLIGGVIYGLSGALLGELRWVLIFGLMGGLGMGLDSKIRSHEFINYSIRNGLIFGLIGGLYSSIVFGLIDGLVYGLVSGPVFGLIGGLLVGQFALKSVQELRKSWKVSLTFGLLSGLGGGLLGGVAGGLSGALSCGLILGLVFGLSKGRRSAEAQMKLVPNQGIRQSLKNAVIVGLIVGLIFAMLGRLSIGLTGGLSIGLFMGLATGLFSGLNSCLQHWVLRWQLYCDKFVPWNYARFLDYTAARLFLRKVGGGYIFVHRLLMEHIASLTEEDIKRITAGLDNAK